MTHATQVRITVNVLGLMACLVIGIYIHDVVRFTAVGLVSVLILDTLYWRLGKKGSKRS